MLKDRRKKGDTEKTKQLQMPQVLHFYSVTINDAEKFDGEIIQHLQHT